MQADIFGAVVSTATTPMQRDQQQSPSKRLSLTVIIANEDALV